MKKSKKRTEIKASDVLKHVLRTGKPFPIPSDYDEGTAHDLGDVVFWDEGNFISVTKAWWARYCGVDGGQVSRWCNAGMPVLTDGRLLFSAVDSWLNEWREEDPARRQPKRQPLTPREAEELRAAIARYQEENE